MGLGVTVGVVGVGVGVGLGLGGGDVLGVAVGVADVLTVADGVTDGRADFVGAIGGLLGAGVLLVGRAVGDVVAGLGRTDGSPGSLSPGWFVSSWTARAPSPTAAAHPATVATIAVVLRRPRRPPRAGPDGGLARPRRADQHCSGTHVISFDAGPLTGE
ncbi:hypothetical protein, partial [Streptosporangium sp. NPDC048865]|uniref:hypothetical protein n=1 Tax=Streptosporangium sp. NPDC048865 TaxID=3155766 RepID=UPI003412AD4A